MNPLLLWIPGTLLLLVGVALIFTQSVSFGAGIAIAMVGAVIESVGILLWIRNRRGGGTK
jgi:uncharacterized membrane protein